MRIRIWRGLCAILIGLFVYQNRNAVLNVAAVVMYAAVFSWLLAPACTRMESKGLRSSYASAIAVISLFFFVLILLAAFIPYLVDQSVHLFKRLSPMTVGITEKLMQWTKGRQAVNVLLSDAGGLLGFGGLTGKLIRAGITTATQVGRIAFSLILTYYVLQDRKRLVCHLLLLVPVQWRGFLPAAICACRNAMQSYFSGLLKTSVFVTAATCLGLLVLGVEDAVLLSVLMGILEILPYIGPILASVPILLSAMMQGGHTALLTAVLLVIVQQVEGNFITPYFTASTTSVHPLSAILGVFVAGNLFGVWGILTALPVMVLTQSVFVSFKQAVSIKKNRYCSPGQKFCACDD